MAFLEFLRASVTETSVATYAEEEVATPASRTESMAMLIWSVEWDMSFPEIIDTVKTQVQFGLSKRTADAIGGFDDPDVIFRVINQLDGGSVQGSLSEYLVAAGRIAGIRHFDPPILYPRASIFFQVRGVNTLVTKQANARVGYTLERVDPGDFIAALVD